MAELLWGQELEGSPTVFSVEKRSPALMDAPVFSEPLGSSRLNPSFAHLGSHVPWHLLSSLRISSLPSPSSKEAPRLSCLAAGPPGQRVLLRQWQQPVLYLQWPVQHLGSPRSQLPGRDTPEDRWEEQTERAKQFPKQKGRVSPSWGPSAPKDTVQATLMPHVLGASTMETSLNYTYWSLSWWAWKRERDLC